ncbi:magnesium transporter [Porticoccus sp. W117]|uniref:magnesium transporter n=1 Tax=Porticoccus sp. W117 TaxID=3054777 RepID=UPI002598388A|nr:magnesium transporter [Porticoccus sp. W117]MDM3871285.1 magnesium transporter [Porticoccus sp. W117]
MPSVTNTANHLEQLELISEALDSGTLHHTRHMLNSLSAPEIADLIESSPPKERHVLWELVDKESEGDVLQELDEDVQKLFLKDMDSEELASLTEGMDVDDMADILQQLPDRITAEVLQAMSDQDRQRVETVLTYDEDTAGGMMDTDTITVRPDLTIDVVLRFLRRHEELPEGTDNLFVVNRKDVFLGILPLRKVLTSSDSITVRELMDTEVEAIPATLEDAEVAHLFERHDWLSAAVVDDDGKLLGRITIDDVVDVIIEEADHSLLGLAGLSDEEDTFGSVRRTAPRRALWLGINLITAIIASLVIKQFSDSIETIVALAVLMPIVASMGGVAGSQTLTVVIRGMAQGQIGRSNLGWLLNKEFGVGLLNGLLWAAVMGMAAGYYFDTENIGWVIAAAMVINLITAAVFGALLPIFLRAINIDPALAGSVVLTTITDVVGFLAFLGLATIYLLP